jgi:hypothetical protein
MQNEPSDLKDETKPKDSPTISFGEAFLILLFLGLIAIAGLSMQNLISFAPR